jgi:3-oxoacyl-[acyl-carrier protein] reductase
MTKRRALVTGAGHGIGAAIATRLATAGYTVGVLDMNADAAESAAASLADGHALVADVTDAQSIDNALDAFGAPPNLLVNNAGIVHFGPVIEESVEDFVRVINVNLIGCYIASRQAAQRMGSGDHIVSITSINGHTPGPGSGAYAAAKAGVRQLMRLLALELAERGIRANSVCPGFIDAGMSEPIYADPKVRQTRSSAVPQGRLGTAEDIANAVAYLDSEAGGYVNGHELVVDGGVMHSLLQHLPRD